MIVVTYDDHMGSDLSVANKARVSFGKKSELEEEHGVWKLKDSDAKLIKYLAAHKHYSPFGH
jgi:thymidylate synthase (FAD)